MGALVGSFLSGTLLLFLLGRTQPWLAFGGPGLVIVVAASLGLRYGWLKPRPPERNNIRGLLGAFVGMIGAGGLGLGVGLVIYGFARRWGEAPTGFQGFLETVGTGMIGGELIGLVVGFIWAR